MPPITVPNLLPELCRARQDRLRTLLQQRRLDAALITDRRHVYYFTGFWCRALYAPQLLILQQGPAILSAPHEPSEEVAADDIAIYESNRLCTMVDDQSGAALDRLRPKLSASFRIGCDGWAPLGLGSFAACEDLRPALWLQRRRKDDDELALIRCAIAATEQAYAYAIDALEPGMTEVELFAGIQRVVAEAVGEVVGEPGNDFQFGSPGGPPRRRAGKAGEIAVLDLGVIVRGYSSDMSRSFVIGRKPSDEQLAACERIEEVLKTLESMAKPGVQCQQLFEYAVEMLDGYRGWKFQHHLGHGIGLNAHEAPRLNPNWDDTLTIGDVFTMEPGLYGDALRAGLRIENDYAVAEQSVTRLSEFPSALA